jgi:MoaA/NifB/PqqE/SkfB family radical SAM enzyme
LNIFFRHTNILVNDILIGSCKIKAFCSYPWTRVKFTPEGDVTMCCFHARKCLGNIFQNSFEEIWFSPLAEQIRKDTSNQILHRTCSGNSCPFSKLKNLPLINFDHGKFPHELEIDLPNQHCNIGGERPNAKNLACLMCERNRRDPDEFYQEDRLEEICFKIKPIMSYIKWVHVQGVAEPFWKNKIFEILKWLDVEGSKVWISTTTNGTLMNANHRKMFLEYPSSTITWSLDAGTAETFKIIRRVDMFDQIIENLMNYSKERKQGQFIHIHNNINTININDVEEMVRIAAKVGVDRLDFNATYDVPAICVNKENVHIFKEAQEKIVYLSRELGVNTTFMRDLTLGIL